MVRPFEFRALPVSSADYKHDVVFILKQSIPLSILRCNKFGHRKRSAKRVRKIKNLWAANC